MKRTALAPKCTPLGDIGNLSGLCHWGSSVRRKNWRRYGCERRAIEDWASSILANNGYSMLDRSASGQPISHDLDDKKLHMEILSGIVSMTHVQLLMCSDK